MSKDTPTNQKPSRAEAEEAVKEVSQHGVKDEYSGTEPPRELQE